MSHAGSVPFESDHFYGSWRHTGGTPQYGEGFEPRAQVPTHIEFDATCKHCGGTPDTNLATGIVQMKCSSCGQNEFVKREILDHRPS